MMNWLCLEVSPWNPIIAWQIPEVRRLWKSLRSHKTRPMSLTNGQILLSCSNSSKWKQMQRLMPGRTCYPGYSGVLLLSSCWDWNGAELTGLCCLVLQLQSLLVFPLSHLGEEADKVGPRLSAMLVPLCVSLGVLISPGHCHWSPLEPVSGLELWLLLLLCTNTLLCELAPFGKSCVEKVMPKGTSWRTDLMQWLGWGCCKPCIPQVPPWCFMFQDEVWCTFWPPEDVGGQVCSEHRHCTGAMQQSSSSGPMEPGPLSAKEQVAVIQVYVNGSFLWWMRKIWNLGVSLRFLTQTVGNTEPGHLGVFWAWFGELISHSQSWAWLWHIVLTDRHIWAELIKNSGAAKMRFTRIFIENKPRSSLTHHCLLSAAYKSAVSKDQDAQRLWLTTHAIKSQNNLTWALQYAAIPCQYKRSSLKIKRLQFALSFSPFNSQN